MSKTTATYTVDTGFGIRRLIEDALNCAPVKRSQLARGLISTIQDAYTSGGWEGVIARCDSALRVIERSTRDWGDVPETWEYLRRCALKMLAEAQEEATR